jgi:hypothetical protein
MALSLSGVLADIEAAIGDADKAVPALQVLVKVAEDAKLLLPVDDQVFVTDGVTIVNALITALSKV